jgi:hypothetical protein
VAYRPYLSIDLYAIEGTGPIILNFASVFHNHGNDRDGSVQSGHWQGRCGHRSGFTATPNENPSQLCIFPGRDAELTWGTSRTSAEWPDGGFLYILVKITYRGAFEETKYMTRVEAIYPIPEGRLLTRPNRPMDVRRAEAT